MDTSNQINKQSTGGPSVQDYHPEIGVELDSITSSAEDASTATLALLLQLPDLLQELTLQLGDDLDTFTCFSRLPGEIRLKIWRSSFPPGRHVNFDAMIGHSFSVPWARDEEAKRVVGIETRCQLPTVFYVNRESRKESLRHYLIVHRDFGAYDWNRNSTTKVRPLFFNPKIDTAFITSDALDDGGFYFIKWLRKVRRQSPRLFDSISSLEIRNWNLSSNELKARMHTRSDYHCPLLSFTEIQSLKLVLTHPSTMLQPDQFSDAGKKMVADELLKVFKGREEWKDRLPAVSAEPWNEFWR